MDNDGWHDVGSEDELADTDRLTVWLDDVDILIVRQGDGSLLALENRCTHDWGDLSGGEVAGGEIVCPRHGARFSLLTGEVLEPPAYEPLTVFPVRRKGGRLQVRLAAGDEIHHARVAVSL